MKWIPSLLLCSVVLPSCAQKSEPESQASYFDNAGRDDVLSGGVKMVTIETPKGQFHVWTKRVGNNPRVKVLLLHGGPGFDHEYLECFDSYFPKEGIEYYYYDQLGSYFSDQPDDSSLWDTATFPCTTTRQRTWRAWPASFTTWTKVVSEWACPSSPPSSLPSYDTFATILRPEGG